ncbi:putative UDP-N-acetylglucosamine pyrophosphorylase [Dictyocoela muelleri]|nr:putative UDP-N-acetylglucosamine pyrophosphorylase [Dictyocoela muelleri]
MEHVCYSDYTLNTLGQKYYKIGIHKLTFGKLCVIILAGGQGTRLGVNYPKGCFLLNGISLFEIHCTNLKRISDTYKTRIMLILMVSRFTEKETKNHFIKNNYFGFSENDVFFIKQGENECFDINGNILMDNETDKCKSPNGNGGVFQAFNNNEILNEIDKRGIEVVNVISVDNVLARCCDPVALGCFYDNSYEILSKGVIRLPNENAGIFVYDEFWRVVEYSEIENKENNNKNDRKNDVKNDQKNEKEIANICSHYFSVHFMKNMKDKKLPIHKAFKKIPCFINGEKIYPKSPNGYKSEFFIFDSFKFSKKLGVIEVPRSLEFSPLKNSSESKVDSPETCIRDLKRRNELIHKNSFNEYDKVFIIKNIK